MIQFFFVFPIKPCILIVTKVRRKSYKWMDNYFKGAVSSATLWSTGVAFIYSIIHSFIYQVYIYCLQYVRHHARCGDTVISKADTVSASGGRWHTEEYKELFTQLGAETGEHFSIIQVQGLLPKSLFSVLKLNSIHDEIQWDHRLAANTGPQHQQKKIVWSYIS